MLIEKFLEHEQFNESISDLQPDLDLMNRHKNLYRFNEDFLPIIPKQNKLTEIESELFLLDPAAKAYEKLKIAIHRNIALGKYRSSKHFSTFKAKKAYESLEQKYNQYISTIMIDFLNQYIPMKRSEIKDLSSFISELYSFLTEGSHVFTVTFSGYMRSSHNSILTNGLSFEFIELDQSNRSKLALLTDRVFKHFRSLALTYGFRLDLNKPNLLVFDLLTDQTKLAYKTMISDHFNVVNELDQLSELAKFAYGSYYNQVEKQCQEISAYSCKKVVNPLEEPMDYIPSDLLFDFYLKLKIAENGKKLSKIEVDKLKKDAIMLKEHFGITEAERFIRMQMV